MPTGDTSDQYYMCSFTYEQKASLCNELNEFLMNMFSYKTAPATFNDSTVHVHRDKVHLYLRFPRKNEFICWPPKTFVISNIGFKHTRKGHGTNLLKFLVSKGPEYGYEYIGIENAFTEPMEKFAAKKGFVETNLSRCYVASIDILRRNKARGKKAKTF